MSDKGNAILKEARHPRGTSLIPVEKIGGPHEAYLNLRWGGGTHYLG